MSPAAWSTRTHSASKLIGLVRYATVARELDLTETALRSWVRQAEIDAGRGRPGALTTEEREELGRLRRENRTLRVERDIPKNARARRRRAIC